MKETPIIFSTDMVRAILDGRKTQTRRIIKPQPYWEDKIDGWNWARGHYWNTNFGQAFGNDGQFEKMISQYCPYGQVGDRLWVRETFKYMDLGHRTVGYRADPKRTCVKNGFIPIGNWKPAIHMPKAFTRIWLEITGIRVERLQEITWKDCKAEGIRLKDCYPTGQGKKLDMPLEFAKLWDSINAKWRRVYNRELKIYEFRQYPWSDIGAKPIPKTTMYPERYHCVPNPWVWVIEFNKT